MNSSLKNEGVEDSVLLTVMIALTITMERSMRLLPFVFKNNNGPRLISHTNMLTWAMHLVTYFMYISIPKNRSSVMLNDGGVECADRGCIHWLPI